MITAEQESNLQHANDRSTKKKQDRVNPHVINVHNGRLMPNTFALRNHKDYRVYTGPKGADESERMRWLASAGRRTPKVIDSSADAPVFDIGKATKEDLVIFAMENYGAKLNPEQPLKELRTAVATLAKADADAESLA